MPRPAVALALGGLATSLVPVIAVLVTMALGYPVSHPAVVALAAFPAGGALAMLMLRSLQRTASAARRGWDQERTALEERRRRLAAETAELQSLELGLLADLEEAEAEVDALHAVSTSLAAALRDSLEGAERRLHAAAQETGRPDLASLSCQMEELLELVVDVDHFARGDAGDSTRPEAFPLVELVRETMTQSRREAGGALTWTLDPQAPSWVPGGPDRLQAVLRAAVRAATRESDGPVHVDIALIERGGVRGLTVRWSAMGEPGSPAPTERSSAAEAPDLPVDLGARLASALREAPISSDDRRLTWWMPSGRPGALVPATLPAARALVAASAAPTRARVRRLLCRWGLSVDMARSTTEALARLDHRAADVVLIDLGGESLSALQQIRERPEWRQLPVLLLGPDADNLVWLPTDPEVGMTRPVRQDGLLAGVEAALGGTSASRRPGQSTQLAPVTHGRRILAVEPSPAAAGRLVRLGAEIGAQVHAVTSSRAGIDVGRTGWDLVLVGPAAHDDPANRVLLERLDPQVPRWLLDHKPIGDSRPAGTAPFPRTSAELLTLLQANDAGLQRAPANSVATASKKVS